MKIGLISDTHIPDSRKELWPQVFTAFRGVDLILHAGDIYDLGVIDALREVAPIYAARGNGDDGSSGRMVIMKKLPGKRRSSSLKNRETVMSVAAAWASIW